MANINEGLKSVLSFLSRLTWKKAILQIIVSLLVILTWFLLQFGDEIATYIKHSGVKDDTKILDDRIPNSAPILRTLSKKTIDEINALANQSDLINGVTIVIVDFQGN